MLLMAALLCDLAVACSKGRQAADALPRDSSVLSVDAAPGGDTREADVAANGDSGLPGTPDVREGDLVGSHDAGVPDALDAPASHDLGGDVASTACSRAIDAGLRSGLRTLLDLVITGQDFEAHEGKRIYVFTRETNSRKPLGYASEVIRSGRFTIRIPEGYARFSYQLIFHYVDEDGDGRCDDTGGDHTGVTTTHGFNPTTDEPLEQSLVDNHRSANREDRACDLLNACR
jgi:hypothetical protein